MTARSATKLSVSAALLALLVLSAAPATAWSAPDPGGNERVNVRLPLERGFIGVNENMGVSMPVQEGLDASRQIGAGVVRTVVSWDALEPAPGVWNEEAWARLEHINREIRRRGMRMLAVLGFAPRWAREHGFMPAPGQLLPPTLCTRGPRRPCVYPPRREMDGAWRDFVRKAATRMRGAMFQTWNEPNWPGFWESGADPERWAELHVAAWEEIRRVRRKAIVIACACATSGTEQEGALGVREFLRRAFSHRPSIRGRYDAIGVNIFPQRGAGAGRKFGAGTWFARGLNDVRRVARKAGDRRPRIVITEIGLWTDGARVPVTRAEQARGLTRIVRRVATMRGVRGVILHRLRASPWETAEEIGMSLLDPETGDPSRAWCWLANMAGNTGARGCQRAKAPRAAIRSGPSNSTRKRSALFRIAKAPGSARLECSVGSRPYRPCGRRLEIRRLRPGKQRLRVRAWTESGMQQRRPVSRSWRVRR